MRVRLVCYENVHEWILGKFALKLKEELVARGVEADIAMTPDPSADVSHHITYWGYQGKVSPVETLMITHIDTPEKEKRLKWQLGSADMGICMSTDTALKLARLGAPAERLCYVNPAHDGSIVPRKTVVGITSRLYDDLRKREELLVELIAGLDPREFTFSIMGGGWQAIVDELRARGMEVTYHEAFDYRKYQELIGGLDYYLYLGQDEGSMGFLDAAAAGVATIVTPQGFHLDAPEAITHRFERLEELKGIFEGIAETRRLRVRSVEGWSWGRYAEKHLGIWKSLLEGAPLPAEVVPSPPSAPSGARAAAPASIHRAGSGELKVLTVLHGIEGSAKGGPSIRSRIVAEKLTQLGVESSVTDERCPDPTGFDLVHVYNAWPPESALELLKHLKRFDVPVVFSPIYLELSEFGWAHQAIRLIFQNAKNDEELAGYLDNLASGTLTVDGEGPNSRLRDMVPGYGDLLRRMFSLSDSVLFLSDCERRNLERRGVFPVDSHLVHNGVDAPRFGRAAGADFSATYGVRDYVLCVGRVELRKNQLLLLEALKDTGVTVVLIGDCPEPEYAELVKRYPKNLLWVEHLPHGDLLISAYQQARVFVLPSWTEGAPLAALEAAAAGVPLVLSNRSGEREYFGDLASYCDPASVVSIRSAVLAALRGEKEAGERARRLQLIVQANYTWENSARETMAAYLDTLKRRGTDAGGAGDRGASRVPETVFDVTACENDIDLAWLDVITWAPVWMTRAERLMLYSLIYSLRPQRYVEVGVFKGGSALIVCAALDSLGDPGRMYCIDIENQVAPQHWDKVKHRAELVIGASPGVLAEVRGKAGGDFDFALVDGDHRYESVVRDAEGIAPFIAPGGHLLFHDAYNEGVGRAIEEFACRHADTFIDLGFVTRETIKGSSPDGAPCLWGGLRLLQKKRPAGGDALPRVVDGAAVLPTAGRGAAAAAPSGTAASGAKSISVLYDISVLGLGTMYQTARTGVYRVVEHVVQGLAAAPEIELSFCAPMSAANPQLALACRHYLSVHPEFAGIPFHESQLPKTQVFHSPFYAIPPEVDAPARFMTVYDLIPILLPQFIPASETAAQKERFQLLKPTDRLLCISGATKEDLCRVTGIEPSRADVTYLAADPSIFHPCHDPHKLRAVRDRYGLGEGGYILSLCTLEPRKNIDHVIRAFARLVRGGELNDVKLVLVGTKGWDFDRIFNEIDANPQLRDRVVQTGYVADEDLAPLYSGALVFVYLSFYEGFGLPPLEAMQCGVPVIASNTSSLPEVVGDAGIMLDPRDLDGLCRELSRIHRDAPLRKELSARAVAQAGSFSWERCVRQTIDAYRAALAPKRKETIVVDGVFFQMNKTGIARLWKSLLAIWSGTDFGSRIVVLDRAGTAPRIPGIRYRNTPAYDCTPPGWDQKLLQVICDEEEAALFVSTYYSRPLTTPSFFLAYDMIPEFTDFYDLSAPQWQEKHRAIQKASAFAAISQSTARDLAKLYPELEGRIALAYCGVDTGFFSPASPAEIEAFKKRHGLTKPFYLFIGRRGEYKNGDLLFQALPLLEDGGEAAVLCVGGGPLEPKYRTLAAGREVELLDLDDDELRVAYSCAAALVYPSKYEGFGLPILEAMACRCPVITCRNSSIPEVAGDAALYVGEENPAQLAQAMRQVREPVLRSRMVEQGALRAREFSWAGMAQTMQAALTRAAGDAGRDPLKARERDTENR